MKYDVIIIGSGLGGLTAGATIAKKGKKVLILEKHNIVGGCATTYQRKGITFEVGLHEMDLGKKSLDMKHLIFKKLGIDKKIELVKIPEFFRFKTENEEYIIPEGYGNAIKYLKEKFPHEAKGIDKYFRKLITTSYSIRRLPFDLSFINFFFYPITTLPIWLINFFNKKSIGKELDGIIKDEKLKILLNTNLVYYHDNPYEFSSFYHSVAQSSYYNSAVFVKGGSQKLSDALADTIRENGGEVRVLSDVKKIEVENRKATSVKWIDIKTREEMTANAKIIVANAAPEIVYGELLDKQYEDKSIKKLENSVSLYTVYITFKKEFKKLFPNNTYSTFISNEKMMNGSLKDMSSFIKDTDIENRNFVFVDYSVIDSGLVKSGDERSFGVITGASYLSEWESLSKEDYTAKKEKLAQILFDKLEKYYPGFKQNIEYYEVSTAKTIKRYTNNPDGTAYGYKQNIKSPRSPRVSPTVKNLHFASAWCFPGGGFTGTIISGYLAGNNIYFPTKWYVVLRTILATIVGTLIGTSHQWINFLIYIFNK